MARSATPAALARHFTRAAQAQDAERAVRYALAAAEQAATMLAHDQAAEHLESALGVLDRFAPDARERRLELLLELGEARIRGGERPRAWGVFREAAAVAAELNDAEGLARAAIGASRPFVLPPGVVDDQLIALLGQALAAYPPGPSVIRVHLLFCLCSALYFSERRDEMRRLSAEATVIAGELGTPGVWPSPPPRGDVPTGPRVTSSAGWPTRASCCAVRCRPGIAA